MSVRVLAPGLLSTVQDDGRHGWRHLGVGHSGAVDAYSFAVANLLVGNASDAPALEISLQGPALHFDRGARIALCGAQVDAHIDETAIPGWRRADVPADSTLMIGACRNGARAYLAIAGGFAVPRMLGSASTDLRAAFGGLRGRMLATGDMLPVTSAAASSIKALRIGKRWIDPAPDLDFAQPASIRLLPGHDTLADGNAVFANEWRVAAASNRQGLRLQGTPLVLADDSERTSEPVFPGTLQLPPDGSPILLLADAQTHGGYPRIGHAIKADHPRLAQLRPGERLRFVACTPADAQRLLREQRQRLARIALALAD